MGKVVLGFLTLLIITGACSKDNPLRVQNGYAGDAAEVILGDNRYEKLILEVAYPKGYALEQGAVNSLVDFIEQYARKPKGIEVVYNELDLPAKDRNSNAIRQIEDVFRTTKASGDELSIFLFVNNGGSPQDQGDSKVLGVAYGSTSFALYGESINENTGGVFGVSKREAETTVLKHEMGHLMGLVNNGSDMVQYHQDAEHGKHCNVESCLMYWAVETNQVFSLLGGGSTPDLDSRCEADLRANGGK